MVQLYMEQVNVQKLIAIFRREERVSNHSGANISVLWEKSRNIAWHNRFNVPGFLLASGQDPLIQRLGSLEC